VGLWVNPINTMLWSVVVGKAVLTSMILGRLVIFYLKCSAYKSTYLLTIETVKDFCYLGSYISTTGNCDQEVNVRIGKAAGVFSKLGKLWKIKNISLSVKTRLYEALVLSRFMNSAELWPVSSHPNVKS